LQQEQQQQQQQLEQKQQQQQQRQQPRAQEEVEEKQDEQKQPPSTRPSILFVSTCCCPSCCVGVAQNLDLLNAKAIVFGDSSGVGVDGLKHLIKRCPQLKLIHVPMMSLGQNQGMQQLGDKCEMFPCGESVSPYVSISNAGALAPNLLSVKLEFSVRIGLEAALKLQKNRTSHFLVQAKVKTGGRYRQKLFLKPNCFSEANLEKKSQLPMKVLRAALESSTTDGTSMLVRAGKMAEKQQENSVQKNSHGIRLIQISITYDKSDEKQTAGSIVVNILSAREFHRSSGAPTRKTTLSQDVVLYWLKQDSQLPAADAATRGTPDTPAYLPAEKHTNWENMFRALSGLQKRQDEIADAKYQKELAADASQREKKLSNNKEFARALGGQAAARGDPTIAVDEIKRKKRQVPV
jgi:hypothetical protein